MASVDLSATEKDRAVRPIGLMLALLLAISSFQVAAAMILPALPAIVASLGASNGDLSLSQSLFFAVGGLAAAGLPLSDRFGRQRMLVVILTLGLLGSVIVATAPGLILFDLGRWLQATGVVALPLSFLILRDNVSADKFPFYIGWLSALNIGITGIDGVIAGWMTDTVGYRGIFWIAAAVGALAIAAAVKVVPRTAPFRRGRTDWAGLIILGLGIVATSVGLAQAGSWGWAAPGTVLILGGGLALLALFVVIEKASAHPLIQIKHLASRRVLAVPLIIVVGMASFMSIFALLMPIWAQTPAAAGGFGFTATQYALAALPGTIIAFIVAPIAGGLARRIGWRPVMIVSTTIAAIGALGLLIAMQSALPAFLFFTLVTFVFSGATMTAANALGVLLSPKRSPAFLPGIVSVMFSFGASFGIAVSGSMLSGSSLSAEPGAATATASFALAFAVALGLLIAAAALTFLVPTDRAQHPRRDTPNGELHAI